MRINRTRSVFFILGLLLAFVSATVAVTAADLPDADSKQTFTFSKSVVAHTLENGLEVYIYPDRTFPVVAVHVVYRVGSRDDPPDRRGLAHLLEHLMFQGSENVAPEEHSRFITTVGGIANAYTTADVTGYWQVVTSDHLESVLRLEAERMHKLVITEENLAKEREVVKNEYRSSIENDPLGPAVQELIARAFAGTPYAWSPVGVPEEMDLITVQEARAFYETYYVPNNAVLVIAGDVEPQAALELVRKHFGPIAPGEVTLGDVVQPAPQPGIITAGFGSPVQLPVVIGGFPIPGQFHPDAPALEMAGLILSSGTSSRLYRALVRDAQIAYVAAGLPVIYRDAGLFIVIAVHGPHISGEQVIEALQHEIAKLAKSPPTPYEVERVRNMVASGRIFSLDSIGGVADMLAASAAVLGDYREVDRRLDAIAQVTAGEITRVVETYLRPERLVAMIVPASL